MPARPDARDVFSAVVLAAGLGTRFGGGKLLAPFGSGCVLDGAVRAAFASPATEVILVTGARAGDVEAAARRTASTLERPDDLRVVHAPDYMSGMAASLRTGIIAVPAERAGTFIFLGDMPCVPPDVAGELSQLITTRHLAAAPVHRGRRGHPALIRRALFEDIEALRGDRGAGSILGRLGPGLLEVPVDHSGIIFDVDRPADLDTGTPIADMNG